MKLRTAIPIVVFLVLLNVFFIFKIANRENDNDLAVSATLPNINDTQAFILPVSQASYLPLRDTNILPPIINAKSAIVYDVNSSRYLYTKNIDQKLPIASLTKLLTAIIVTEKLNLKDIVTIPKEAIKVDGERQDLYLNERLAVGDLLKIMLIKSSNDAAYALASHAESIGVNFVAEMNSLALNLDMVNSRFKDPAGLNDEAYSSVGDIVKLVRYSLDYPILWEILSQKETDIVSLDGIAHHIQSTDQLLGQIPDIVGGKTGFTDEALGCMILVVQVSENNDRIISIVLGSGQRFTDTKNLVEWIRQAYRWQ